MWTRFLYLMVLFGLGACTPGEDACPMGFQSDEYLRVLGNKCYKLTLWSRVAFEGAKMYCEGQGGYLVSIKDQATQTFLMTQAKKLNYKGRIWIGLSDTNVKGDLEWADGSEMTYSNFAKDQAKSLSDMTTPYRHCVAMDTMSGLWYDNKCGTFGMFPLMQQNNPYICEFSDGNNDDRPTPPPETK